MKKCKKILSGLLAVGLLVNPLNVTTGKIGSAQSDKWEKTINSRLHSQIKKLEEKMNLLNREIASKQAEMDETQKSLNDNVAKMCKLAKFKYMGGDALELELIFSIKSVENSDAKQYISEKKIKKYHEIIEDSKEKINNLQSEGEELNKLKKEVEVSKSALDAKAEELNKRKAKNDKIVSNNSRGKSANKKNSGSRGKPSETKVLTGKKKCWPVLGSREISSGWGDKRRHNGIDIRANEGTKVVAAADGVVVEANSSNHWGHGWGYHVRILHPDGSRTMYAHLSRVDAQIGQHVQAGEVIGAVGSTGYSTGNHLHFGVMVNGRWVNPMLFL